MARSEYDKETQTHRESLLCPRHIEDGLSSFDRAEYDKGTQTHKESLMYPNPNEVRRLLSPDRKMDISLSEQINLTNNKTHQEKQRTGKKTVRPTGIQELDHTNKRPDNMDYGQFSLPDFKSQFLENKYPDRNDSTVKMEDIESKFYRNADYPISLYGRKTVSTYLGLTGYPEFDVDDNSTLPRTPSKPQPEPTFLQLKREDKYQQEKINDVKNRIRQVKNIKYPQTYVENYLHDLPQRKSPLRDHDMNKKHGFKDDNLGNMQRLQNHSKESTHSQQTLNGEDMTHRQKRNLGETHHSLEIDDDKNLQSRSSSIPIENHYFPRQNLETPRSSSNVNREIENRHSPPRVRVPHRITPLNYVELNKRDFRKTKPELTYSEMLKHRKEQFEKENLNGSKITKNSYEDFHKESNQQLSMSPKRKGINLSGAKSHEDLWNRRSLMLGATRDSKMEPSRQSAINSKEMFEKYPVLGEVQVSRQSNRDKGDDHKFSININVNLDSHRDVDQKQMKTQALPKLENGKESRRKHNGFSANSAYNDRKISPVFSDSTSCYTPQTHEEFQVDGDQRQGLSSKVSGENGQYSSSLPSHRRNMKVGRHGLYPIHDYHDYTQARKEAKLTSLVGTGDLETMSEKRERVTIHQQYGRLIRQKNKQDETKAKRAMAATGPRKVQWVM